MDLAVRHQPVASSTKLRGRRLTVPVGAAAIITPVLAAKRQPRGKRYTCSEEIAGVSMLYRVAQGRDSQAQEREVSLRRPDLFPSCGCPSVELEGAPPPPPPLEDLQLF
jgi:hypothetical protein